MESAVFRERVKRAAQIEREREPSTRRYRTLLRRSTNDRKKPAERNARTEDGCRTRDKEKESKGTKETREGKTSGDRDEEKERRLALAGSTWRLWPARYTHGQPEP